MVEAGMNEKRTDQAGTKKQMPTIEHVAEAETEPERRPDDEEVDTAAEQRPPSDSWRSEPKSRVASPTYSW